MLVFAGNAFADWLEIDRTYRDEVTFIDSSRIRHEGAKSFYWSMSSYSHPRLLFGKSVISQVNQTVVDCKRQIAAVLFFAWYVGPNATGESVNTMTILESNAEFHPIIPNSIGDKEAKVACANIRGHH